MTWLTVGLCVLGFLAVVVIGVSLGASASQADDSLDEMVRELAAGKVAA